jgi:hypothetical protein
LQVLRPSRRRMTTSGPPRLRIYRGSQTVVSQVALLLVLLAAGNAACAVRAAVGVGPCLVGF